MKPLDFCCETLGTNATSDKCAVDGFEVTNLISKSPQNKQKGFLVEHFIRPPVNIEIKFPCAVNISYIVVKTNRGASKILRLCINSKASGCSDWSKVCTESNLEDELTLKSGRMLPSYLQIKTIEETGNTRICRPLKHVECIQFTILAMKDCVAVQVPSIKVYAVPSKSVPLDHMIYNILNFKSKYSPRVPITTQASTSRTINSEITNTGSTSSSSQEVPEEFLDKITFHIMSIPVLLPSGNIIDKSTLERHEENERRWGRKECDPFTGIPFESRNMPVVLTELKSRIDRYLSTKQIDDPSIARVVDGQKKQKQAVSRLVAPGDAHKRFESEMVEGKATLKRITPPDEDQNTTKEDSGTDMMSVLGNASDLESSFNQALLAARSILNRSKELKRRKTCCVICESENVGYKLLCDHMVCRSCALRGASIRCKACCSSTTRAQIIKVNML